MLPRCFFQEKMSDLMQHLNFVRNYLDDILEISSSNFDDHLVKLEVVLSVFSDEGVCVNAENSTFCDDEIEYLGNWISKSDIQTIPNKV
jgi:hypothetical protein